MENIIIPILLFTFIILWVWSLLDLVFSTFKKSKWKIAWLLIIIFFPLLGSILYLLLKEEFKVKKRRFTPQFRPQNRDEF